MFYASDYVTPADKLDAKAPAMMLPPDALKRAEAAIAKAIGETIKTHSGLPAADQQALVKGLNVSLAVEGNRLVARLNVSELGANAATLQHILNHHFDKHPLIAAFTAEHAVDALEGIKKEFTELRAAGVAIPEHFDKFFDRENPRPYGLQIHHSSNGVSVQHWDYPNKLTAEQTAVFADVFSGSNEESFKRHLTKNLLKKLKDKGKIKEGEEATITEAVNKLHLDVNPDYGISINLRSPEQIAHEKDQKDGHADKPIDQKVLLASNPLSHLDEADIKRVVANTMFHMLAEAKDVTPPGATAPVKPATLFADIAGIIDMERALHDIFAEAKKTKPELGGKMDALLNFDYFSEARKRAIEDSPELAGKIQPATQKANFSVQPPRTAGAHPELELSIEPQNYGHYLAIMRHLAGIEPIHNGPPAAAAPTATAAVDTKAVAREVAQLLKAEGVIKGPAAEFSTLAQTPSAALAT